MSHQPPRRKKKKSGGRKRSSNLLFNVAVVAAFTLTVGLLVFVVTKNDVVTKLQTAVTQATAKPVIPAWPPPPDTPREKVFGSHDNETIVPMSVDVIRNPMRRRSCDSWFQLSNLRIGEGPQPFRRQSILIDVEILQLREGSHPTICSWENGTKSGTIIGFSHELNELIREKKKKGTMSFQLPMRLGSGGFTTSTDLGNIEVFLEDFDDKYRHRLTVLLPGGYESTQPSFKVSNSVVHGSITKPAMPRDWCEEEYQHFLVQPQSEVTVSFRK
jgi:hypothetical protein